MRLNLFFHRFLSIGHFSKTTSISIFHWPRYLFGVVMDFIINLSQYLISLKSINAMRFINDFYKNQKKNHSDERLINGRFSYVFGERNFRVLNCLQCILETFFARDKVKRNKKRNNFQSTASLINCIRFAFGPYFSSIFLFLYICYPQRVYSFAHTKPNKTRFIFHNNFLLLVVVFVHYFIFQSFHY